MSEGRPGALVHDGAGAPSVPSDALGASPLLPVGDNRPNVYRDPDGTIVYRASSLGSCIRSLVAYRNQVATPRPHSAVMLERFAEGNRAEPQIVAWLGTAGWVVTDAGEAQVEYDLPVLPGVVVRCHPDGLAVRKGEPTWTSQRVLEVKALSDGLADKGLYALKHYPWQLSIEMLATGRKALYVVYNKGFDEVDERSVVVKEIDVPPYSLAQVKARVAKVEAAGRGDDLPDCNQNDFPCQWYGIVCQQQAMVRPEAETDDDVEGLCAALFDARMARKRAEAQEKEARQELEHALGDRPRVRAGAYVARRTVFERQTFDSRALKDAEPQVYEKYTVATEASRLTVEMAIDGD